MARIKIELPEHFPYSCVIETRVDDLNFGGHMGNEKLLALAHEARLRFLNTYGYSETDACGTGLIMVDAGIEYKKEAFRGDRLQFEMAAGDFHKKGFDILYRVTREQDQALVAKLKTGMMCFDYTSHKPTSLPEEVENRLKGGDV